MLSELRPVPGLVEQDEGPEYCQVGQDGLVNSHATNAWRAFMHLHTEEEWMPLLMQLRGLPACDDGDSIVVLRMTGLPKTTWTCVAAWAEGSKWRNGVRIGMMFPRADALCIVLIARTCAHRCKYAA